MLVMVALKDTLNGECGVWEECCFDFEHCGRVSLEQILETFPV